MKNFLAVVLFAIAAQMTAQTYEVGLFAGGANNIGDVGRTNFIYPSGMAFGGILKWNRSKRYAWRASVIHGNFTADDTKASSSGRQERGYEMDNSITEASLGLEVNFVEYNLHKLGPAFTPYLYTGFTYFRYKFKHFEAGQLQDYGQTDGSIAIPMTLGLKWRLNQFLILGAEAGVRYTFTDNLDGSNPEGSNYEQYKFGNIYNNDWYTFCGMTLTYTFGRKPCMDCFE